MMVHQTVVKRLHHERAGSQRDEVPGDRMMKVLLETNDQRTKQENIFLKAATNGDAVEISNLLATNIDVNVRDDLSRSALELALMSNHSAVVAILLPRMNIMCIEEALMYVIDKENVKMCELILSQPTYKNRRHYMQNNDAFYEKNASNLRKTFNTTPITMAAVSNNFYIVKLVVNAGASISMPHDYFCACVECYNMKTFDAVRRSQTRLNTYKALASPAYMSLVCEDPILQAFELSDELDKLSTIEKEYKSEYAKLSGQCRKYALELLNQCRSTEDIAAILNEAPMDNGIDSDSALDADGYGIGDSFSRVKIAIKYSQKQFIAHATCQQQLTLIWYRGWTWIRNYSTLAQILMVPMAGVLLPFTALVYTIAPNSVIGKKMQIPYVKFINQACSYTCFLMLIFLATARQGSGSTYLDVACKGMWQSRPDSIVITLIFVWVVGMLVNEVNQLWGLGIKGYTNIWWNWMDSTLLSLYVTYFTLQTLVFYKIHIMPDDQKVHFCPHKTLKLSCKVLKCIADQELLNWNTYMPPRNCSSIETMYTASKVDEDLNTMSDINQLSDIFFALANLLSFARVIYLLPANEQLGPLLVSFGRMLRDVIQFSVIFLLVFLAFMCGLTSLYRVHRCENNHFTRLDKTLNSLFWATFGMGDTSAALIDKRHLASNRKLVTTHTTHHPLTVIVGYALFWFYIMAVMLVLLNMLIAMMSNSFQEIYDDHDVEWKFARTKLWIDFFDEGSVLPAPFNLLPNVGSLFEFMYIRAKRGIKSIYKPNSTDLETEMDGVNSQTSKSGDYKSVVKMLVNRYIYYKELESNDNNQYTNGVMQLKQSISGLKSEMNRLTQQQHLYSKNLKKQNSNDKMSPIILTNRIPSESQPFSRQQNGSITRSDI